MEFPDSLEPGEDLRRVSVLPARELGHGRLGKDEVEKGFEEVEEHGVGV